MTLPTLNVDLMSDLLTWAYADQKKIDDMLAKFPGWGSWVQGVWAREIRNGVCQTAFCMAGQAVTQAGFALDLEFYEDVEEYDPDLGRHVATGKKVYSASECYPARRNGKDSKGRPRWRRTGANQNIGDTAQELLGLTYSERSRFFSGDNSLAYLVYLATGFARVRGVTLNLNPEILAVGEAYQTRYDFSDDVRPYEFHDGIDASDYQTLYDNFGKIPESV